MGSCFLMTQCFRLLEADATPLLNLYLQGFDSKTGTSNIFSFFLLKSDLYLAPISFLGHIIDLPSLYRQPPGLLTRFLSLKLSPECGPRLSRSHCDCCTQGWLASVSSYSCANCLFEVPSLLSRFRLMPTLFGARGWYTPVSSLLFLMAMPSAFYYSG